MSEPYTCPQGHTWNATNGSDTACPVCDSRKTLVESAGPESPKPERWPQVPGYEIMGRIGQGGMGVVYKARQTRLNRIVALKMLAPGADATPDLLGRFRTEAEAAARLQHPNIVSIYEIGDHEFGPYFSLEYVEGGSLDQQLHGIPQSPKVAARSIETVARAMHYAHEQGIVHRDLKPGNILLSFGRERPPGADENGAQTSHSQLHEAIPMIADFGLAKLLSIPSNQTKTGDVLGTPSYMAPEQAGGVTKQITAAVDIYALGAILYEMLTGRPPFLAASPVETVLLVLTADPVSIRRLQAQTPRDLETICLRCLEKTPRKRYQTAAALAEDLHRFLIGEPIVARPVGRLERLGKWCRRRPAVAALIGLAVVSLVVGIVGAVWHTQRLQKEVVATEGQRNRAELHLRSVQDGISRLTTVSQEHLVPMPNTRQAQKAILEAALQIYQDLLEKEPGHPGMRHVQARAHWEFSKLHLTLERLDDALASSRSALALFEQLLEEDKANSIYRQDVARAHLTLGNVHRARRKDDDAESAFIEARTRLEKLTEEYPDNADFRRHLAIVCNNAGNLYLATKRFPDALAMFEKAVNMRELILHVNPQDTTNRRELAVNFNNLGRYYQEYGQTDRSIAILLRALGELRELPADVMTIPTCRHEWAMTWMNLGKAYQSNNRPEADNAFRQSIQRYEALVKDFPDAPVYRQELGSVYRNLGFVLISNNRIDDAIEAFRQSTAHFERLVAENAAVSAYSVDLSTSLRFLGDLLHEPKRSDEAEKVLRRSVEIARGQVAKKRDSAANQSLLGSALYSLGIALRDTSGRIEESRSAFEEAAVHQNDAKRLDPSNAVYYRHELAFNYDALSGVLIRLEAHNEAAEAAEKYLDVSPKDKDAYGRAAGHIAHAAELAAKSDPKLAEALAQRSLALLRDAKDKGLRDAKELGEDKFPEWMRKRSDYQQLIDELGR